MLKNLKTVQPLILFLEYETNLPGKKGKPILHLIGNRTSAHHAPNKPDLYGKLKEEILSFTDEGWRSSQIRAAFCS